MMNRRNVKFPGHSQVELKGNGCLFMAGDRIIVDTHLQFFGKALDMNGRSWLCPTNWIGSRSG